MWLPSCECATATLSTSHPCESICCGPNETLWAPLHTRGRFLPPFLPGGLGRPVWPQSRGWLSSVGGGCPAQRLRFINKSLSWKQIMFTR